MEWSDEELSDVMSRGSSAAPTGIRVPALPASTLKAMMTRAVKLVAARGGTMTEERVREYIKEGSDLGEHLATLGARNAVLEAAERATFRDGRDEGYTEGAEAMRAACLKDVREALANVGAWDRETERIVASAIEGATS